MKLFSYIAHFFGTPVYQNRVWAGTRVWYTQIPISIGLYYLKIEFPYCLELEFVKFKFEASFGRREQNGMEINENNNFWIFFPSLVWEF